MCSGCGHKRRLGWTESPVNKKCRALWPGLCWALPITCSKPLFQIKRTYKTSNTVFPSSCRSSSSHQICYESPTHGCEIHPFGKVGGGDTALWTAHMLLRCVCRYAGKFGALAHPGWYLKWSLIQQTCAASKRKGPMGDGLGADLSPTCCWTGGCREQKALTWRAEGNPLLWEDLCAWNFLRK